MKTRHWRLLGSARDSRAGDGDPAIANFSVNARIRAKIRFREAAKRERESRALPRALLTAFLLFLICVPSAFPATLQEQIAARAGLEQKLGAQLPLRAQFRDEHGRTVELGSFFSTKPVILALAYYECPNLCTLVLNGILQTAQELRLDAGKDYQIVVVSFDWMCSTSSSAPNPTDQTSCLRAKPTPTSEPRSGAPCGPG